MNTADREPIDVVLERAEPILALSQEYAETKKVVNEMSKRLKVLAEKIKARQDVGYSDQFITLRPRNITDLKSEKLWKAIEKEGVIDVCSERVLRAKLVESIALTNKRIAKALEESKIDQVLLTLTGSGSDDE